ncbi:hypothetical protein [Mucilaginibacter sp.]|uniref:hypothetical protein n=1 Tax=Mucilaginibacter sp. TaxID=1882438 RepID=UPI0025F2731A|nr:hypothetical protein [Mucilaginibacter sp.]
MKKFKYFIPIAAIVMLSSFAAFDVLSTVHLTKEQFSDRLLAEMKSEEPGSFLNISTYEAGKFGLDVTFDQFKAVGTANYKTTLLQSKAEIMQTIQSPYFQQQWEAWITSQKWFKANNIHELAADNVGNTLSAVLDESKTKDDMVEDVNSIKNSAADNITDADNRLKEKGIPPGAIKRIKDEKQKAVSILIAIKIVEAKEPAGDEIFKAAYVSYKHTQDVLDEIDGINVQLNSINEDMKLWSAGASAEHKKITLADKQRYEAEKLMYTQVFDKKKVSNAAFEIAYVDFVREKKIQEEMANLKDEDVQARKNLRNPYLHLKPILQQFLSLTDGMDFKATLKDNGKYKIFANLAFESKSYAWKFYFRRGEAFTGSAREIVKQWITELK